MYGIVHEEIEKHLDERVRSEANALLAVGGARPLAGIIEAVRWREAQSGPGALAYLVQDDAGRRVAGSLDAKSPPPGFTEFVHFRHADGTRGIAQAYGTTVPGGGYLVVAVDRSDVDRMDKLILTIFGVATAMIVATGLGLAFGLRRMIQRRLAAMSATAEEIMDGDLSKRMPLLRDAEFDQVSEVINDMLERIEALLENLRQLSTDLAHDIRSPLNRARNSLEALALSQGDDVVATALAEIDDLIDLVNGLLGISEIEGFSVRARFVALDLGQLAADVVGGFDHMSDTAGVAITCTSDPALILGDAALLRRALANLIENAMLHAIGARTIAVTVTRHDRGCSVAVSDDGIGVPAKDHEAIFRRFVRLDISRSAPGHGLGLNLVAAIASAHRGTAGVKSSAKGLTIELLIPPIHGLEGQ